MATGAVADDGPGNARAFRERRVGLHMGVQVVGWFASIGSVLLFGLPPLFAVAALMLAHAPALFAPST